MMKAVLRIIGVATLFGSAACLPTFDQPAAKSTVANPDNPTTTAVAGTGDSTSVAPLSPAQQTAIWMQGGDPTLLANRAYDEGPIEVASQKHACGKMQYNTMGRLLMSRGVAIVSGVSPASLPVTSGSVCPVDTGNSQSASFVYCNSQLTLGIPQYAARLGESTNITSGTGTKMMDLYATAATEIESKLVGNAFATTVTACVDPLTSKGAMMFNTDNTCNEAGITCLQGYPASADQVALCSSVVTQANTAGMGAGVAGRRLAIATILAGTQLCD